MFSFNGVMLIMQKYVEWETYFWKGGFHLKRIPERTCIGCHETKPKRELVRIVKDKENSVSVDLTGKKDGRGAYICAKQECLDKAIKSNKLSRAFELVIDEKIYEDLRDVIASIPKKG